MLQIQVLTNNSPLHLLPIHNISHLDDLSISHRIVQFLVVAQAHHLSIDKVLRHHSINKHCRPSEYHQTYLEHLLYSPCHLALKYVSPTEPSLSQVHLWSHLVLLFKIQLVIHSIYHLLSSRSHERRHFSISLPRAIR